MTQAAVVGESSHHLAMLQGRKPLRITSALCLPRANIVGLDWSPSSMVYMIL